MATRQQPDSPHPDFPIDPATGQPARSAAELQTGRHQVPDLTELDYGAIFALKLRLGPLDGSDEEAAETWHRYSPPDERFVNTGTLFLERLANRQAVVRETSEEALSQEPWYGRHVQELDEAKTALSALSGDTRAVMLWFFGLQEGHTGRHSLAEIAHEEGVSEFQCRLRLDRGLAYLGKRLSDAEITSADLV